jgi:hypothetical protein
MLFFGKKSPHFSKKNTIPLMKVGHPINFIELVDQ